jgi:ribosome-associated toxin RatA of RatAB toxin-antitoxin module
MSGATRSITINASREKVFEVISDFEDYPEFLPEMKNVGIDKKTAKEVVAFFTLNMMKEINYTLKLKLTKPSSISWTLVEGDVMSKNSGSWKLKKVSPRKTDATYTIDVQFGSFVPGFISNMLVESSLPKMMGHFKKRIENG